MAQKHLNELLKEDQEPFHLKVYIADKRNQFKGPSQKTSLQVKKIHPICETSNFPGKFCKSSCLFSFKDTPDLRKSPLFDCTPLSKSPGKSPKRIFLHVPTRTSALLLEAALRIHKQSYCTKSKTQNENHGFRLFRSILKRLKPKNRTQKREIKGEVMKVSVKDILRWDSSVGRGKFYNGRKAMDDEKVMLAVEDNQTAAVCSCEMNFSCSCTGRPSSAVRSPRIEVKSSEMDTYSCSSILKGSEEIAFISDNKKVPERAGCGENSCCESPYRFVLQRSPSPGGRTPEFCSPAVSPVRGRTEDKGDNGAECFKRLQTEEEDEEREQFSPVSVLDTPFEDDCDGRGNDYEKYGAFDMRCSYSVLQNVKLHLLQKLCRFEKLAKLDPVELEKTMSDQDGEDDEETDPDGEVVSEDNDKETSDKEMDLESFSTGPSFLGIRGIPSDMKRLVSDLINEEERRGDALSDKDEVVKRVCKKIELWTDVESNTIDMMVEQDLITHTSSWKNCTEHKSEMAMEIELSILSILMNDLSSELASTC